MGCAFRKRGQGGSDARKRKVGAQGSGAAGEAASPAREPDGAQAKII
jgi:hypothetical protein